MEGIIQKNILDEDIADYYFTMLSFKLPWKRQLINGKDYFHRSIYRYDLNQNIEEMDELINVIEQNIYRKVEGVFCNLYKNGSDYAPYHRDDYGCDIVSLSLGATRKFYFKNDETKIVKEYQLKNGDLFYFPLEINKNYKHSIPVQKNIIEPRINITCFLEDMNFYI